MANNDGTRKVSVLLTVFIFGIIAMYISRMLILMLIPTLATIYLLGGSVLLSGFIIYLILSQMSIK